MIEKTPNRLQEVDGIGPGRRAKIVAAWDDQKVVRQIMVFLHGHGVSASRAFRIHKEYGQDAIEKVKQDPYRLARDIWGIGFKTADQIAASLGIGRQSALRARAGVEHVLQELTQDGHCACPRDQLEQKAQTMLEIAPEIIEAAIEHGIGEGRLMRRRSRVCRWSISLASVGRRPSLRRTWWRLCHGEHPCPAMDAGEAAAKVEAEIGFALAPQREALARGLSRGDGHHRWAGRGEDDAGECDRAGLPFTGAGDCTLWPTGRAARRMAEATGMEAKTIHRLLEFAHSTGGFKHDARIPLSGQVFIVDELSMVDLMLADRFVRVPKGAALNPRRRCGSVAVGWSGERAA